MVLWRKRGVPCYAATRVDGLDVTHSVAVARGGSQTVGSGHPRTPCDPPRHAPLSPCSALHTSTARHAPNRSPRRCVPYTTASALHCAHLPLYLCSLQHHRSQRAFQDKACPAPLTSLLHHNRNLNPRKSHFSLDYSEGNRRKVVNPAAPPTYPVLNLLQARPVLTASCRRGF